MARNKILQVLIIILSFFIFPLVSEGVNWMYFVEDDHGEKHFIDTDSIKDLSDHIISVMKKVEPQAPSKYSFILRQINLDCKKKLIKTDNETAYLKTGKLKNRPINSSWQQINPEEIDDLLMEMLCGLKRSRQ